MIEELEMKAEADLRGLQGGEQAVVITFAASEAVEVAVKSDTGDD